MTRMSLVHCGIEVCVAVDEAGALALDDVAAGADVLAELEADVAAEVPAPGDVLCEPDPEDVLLHPASTAPAMSTKVAIVARLRIIELSSAWST